MQETKSALGQKNNGGSAKRGEVLITLSGGSESDRVMARRHLERYGTCGGVPYRVAPEKTHLGVGEGDEGLPTLGDWRQRLWRSSEVWVISWDFGSLPNIKVSVEGELLPFECEQEILRNLARNLVEGEGAGTFEYTGSPQRRWEVLRILRRVKFFQSERCFYGLRHQIKGRKLVFEVVEFLKLGGGRRDE